MTVTVPGELSVERDDSRFAAAVAALRTRATAADAERWFRLAGPVFIPLGALMIVLAWYGAAHTTRVFLQIPYLISGGLLGLGFMFVGGFTYYARWMTDLLAESRAQAAQAEETAVRTAEALERIEALLAAQGAIAAGTAEPADAAVVMTRNGKLVHRPDCRLVAGRETTTLAAADVNGRDACQICEPALH